jgi:hypothetical protein
MLPSIINYLFLYHRSLYVAFEALIRLHHSSVDKKLDVWRQGYLKRRAEPKKYEDMLYFLDLYNWK